MLIDWNEFWLDSYVQFLPVTTFFSCTQNIGYHLIRMFLHITWYINKVLIWDDIFVQGLDFLIEFVIHIVVCVSIFLYLTF